MKLPPQIRGIRHAKEGVWLRQLHAGGRPKPWTSTASVWRERAQSDPGAGWLRGGRPRCRLCASGQGPEWAVYPVAEQEYGWQLEGVEDPCAHRPDIGVFTKRYREIEEPSVSCSGIVSPDSVIGTVQVATTFPPRRTSIS